MTCLIATSSKSGFGNRNSQHHSLRNREISGLGEGGVIRKGGTGKHCEYFN